MALFKRRNRQPADIPTHDPTHGDPVAATLLSDLGNRDWRAVRDLLGSIRNPDDLHHYLGFCNDHLGVQAWIEDWIEAEPQSYLPFLVGGSHAIRWAWLGRGTKLAKDTLPAQFQLFQRRLRKAHALLVAAIERNPDDATAWAQLITCGMGMGLGLDEARHRFAEATARHRWHIGAHHALHTQLLAKWGGSHELSLEFAEATAASAPPSSGLATLVAISHVEHWVRGDDETENHMTRPETVAALHAAADRSVRHPDYRPRPGWQDDFNAFAMVFWQADQPDAAAQMFDRIGDQVTEYPWSTFYSSYPTRFAHARDESLQLRTTPRG